MTMLGRFNPCFSGSCIRIVFVLGYTIYYTTVSILVLVDLAFEFYQESIVTSQ